MTKYYLGLEKWTHWVKCFDKAEWTFFVSYWSDKAENDVIFNMFFFFLVLTEKICFSLFSLLWLIDKNLNYLCHYVHNSVKVLYISWKWRFAAFRSAYALEAWLTNFYGNHTAGNLGPCECSGKWIREDLVFVCGLVCLSVTKSR